MELLFTQLVCGALGGNLVGILARRLSLGTVGNTLVGAIGGGIAGKLLMLGAPVLAASMGANVFAAGCLGALIALVLGAFVSGMRHR